ncbi:tail fiber domain-containing protein [Citrobacter freundii]|nr:tail fiber domain-containing protein [Citrobacter freundii]WFV10651.1 tail fiber domain-containing protein [Citrobacter freundii]
MATKSDGAVPVNQGGTGGKTKEDARTNLGLGNSSTRNIGTVTGTVAAGDDPRLNTVNGKTSGVVKGDFFSLDNSYGHTTQLLTYNPGTVGTYFGGMSMKRPNSQGWILSQYTTTDYEVQSVTIGIDAPGANVNWIFNRNGQATGTWVNNSDSRIKKDIKPIPEPLVAMKKIRGCSWTRLDSGVTGFGFIAQEVREVFPEAVHDFGQTMTMEDGKEVENVLSVDTSGVSAALHHEAILALIVEIEELKTEMKSLTGVGR